MASPRPRRADAVSESRANSFALPSDKEEKKRSFLTGRDPSETSYRAAMTQDRMEGAGRSEATGVPQGAIAVASFFFVY